MNREEIFGNVFTICKKAIAEVLAIKSKEISPFFRGYINYPVLSYGKNGFPSVFKSPYGNEKVIDYEQYFLINPHFDKNKVNITNYPEYEEIMDSLKKCEKYLDVYSMELDNYDLVEFSLKNSVINLVCKVLLEYGEENELSKEQLIEFYRPIENRIILDELPIDIYIPILFTKFELKQFNLTDSISIVEMDELLQKSRSEIDSYTEGIPNSVFMSATHALKFENYSVSNFKYWLSQHIFGVVENYPTAQIGTFFNILRLEGILSGYAQIVARPVKWVDHYKADLIDLKGIAMRQYPVIFNNYYWNRESFQIINEETLVNIQQIFIALLNKPNKKIDLAFSRLENSFYRNKEGDRIIDIVIGLESILSDGEKTELTHKLSLRAAFLLQHSSLGETKLAIFKNMKAIYDYRSAVVHGENQDKLEKKRYLYTPSGEKKLVTEVAESYLKECIKILIHIPKFLKANKIDEELILVDLEE